MYAESSLLKFVKNHKKKGRRNMVGGDPFMGTTNVIKGREMFFIAVFGTLIFQVCLTFWVMNYSKNSPLIQDKIRQYIFGLILLQFAFILILAFIPMHPIFKFVLFTLFAFTTGIVLSTIASTTSQEIIKASIVGTISIFVLMVIFGLVLSMLGFDLSWMAGILFATLLVLILVRIVTMFMTTSNNFKKSIAVFALLLFGVFVVFDTNNILQRDYNGDFVTASLDYFLDILNIFVNLVQLVGGES